MKAFLVILLTLSLVSVVRAEVARPSNLKLEKPDSGVPAECTAFFSETGWSGRWEQGRAAEVWIEKIHSDCTAEVVYAYGFGSQSWAFPSYQRATSRPIINEEMVFDLKFPVPDRATITATVTLRKNGDALKGLWRTNVNSEGVKADFTQGNKN